MLSEWTFLICLLFIVNRQIIIYFNQSIIIYAKGLIKKKNKRRYFGIIKNIKLKEDFGYIH